VDQVARRVISKAGYGEFFGHGTGHGVGLQIHEGPRLNQSSKERLEPGMVVTVEPGIYLPGFGGVRIEDLVVVTEKGWRNLTSMDKEYREIPVRWSGASQASRVGRSR
jgi:Xaa-Pro aminopeptidase